MLVGLTGATGYVGRFIAKELHERGATVRALGRGISDRTGFSGPVEWLTGSLQSDEVFAEFVCGADAIVHCALEHVPGRYRGGEGDDLARFIEVNVGGALRLMQAARNARIPRFILLSSRAAYGDSGRGGQLQEDGLTNPDTHYGACKAALEAFVYSWGRGEHWDICALRPTGVYGVVHPIQRTKWLGLIDAIRRGEAWPESRCATEVHGSDVARAVWMLLTADGIAGRVFNCSDLMVSTTTVAQIVQRTTGARGPLPPHPSGSLPRIMSCGGLHERGFHFGGVSLLEQTIGEIISILEAGEDTSHAG
jgi:nucleoside-diphosphate-sugar epimerase